MANTYRMQPRVFRREDAVEAVSFIGRVAARLMRRDDDDDDDDCSSSGVGDSCEKPMNTDTTTYTIVAATVYVHHGSGNTTLTGIAFPSSPPWAFSFTYTDET